MEITWKNCFSSKRFGMEDIKNDIRTEYERDWDRIIFSSSFRRLQNKTQVFPLPEEVFVHNRLTHSLEVASIGRSLGKIIGRKISELDEIKNDNLARPFYKNSLKNVVSSACLAHDLGNPPFGHSGEKAISTFFSEGKGVRLKEKQPNGEQLSPMEWEDLTHFEGNANAFRILTHQFEGRRKGGFVLTYTTLASIVK